MIALFLIPFLTPAIAAWGERARVALLPGGDALRWAGVALSALGFGLRIAAMRSLGARFSPFVAVQPGHALETRGVYARIRHPGYAGSLLASLGAVLAFGSAIGLLPVVLLLALLLARIRREESMLAGHFGEAWRDYRKATGALLPGRGR
jgi:protein-S-isoprenylcysteine O-methyltransferase Ste14